MHKYKNGPCIRCYNSTISRLLKIKGLFCRLQSLLQGSFAKETNNFKEPIHRGHPIYINIRMDHVYDAAIMCLHIYMCTYIYVHLYLYLFLNISNVGMYIGVDLF